MLYFILQLIRGGARKMQPLPPQGLVTQPDSAGEAHKTGESFACRPQIARSFLVKQPFFSANRAFSALYFPASRL
jgi:hypothetical protein